MNVRSLLNKAVHRIMRGALAIPASKPGVDFIHLPKTGGTSVRKAIGANSLTRLFLHRRDHDVSYADLDDSSKTAQSRLALIVVREPEKWYVSLYNFKMNSNPECPVKDYPRMEANDWDDFFDDCVLLANGKEGLKKWFKPWEPYHDRICACLLDGEGLYSAFYRFYLSVDAEDVRDHKLPSRHSHRLQFLRLTEFEDDLNHALKVYFPFFPRIRLSRENRSWESRHGFARVSDSQREVIRNRDAKLFDWMQDLRSQPNRQAPVDHT